MTEISAEVIAHSVAYGAKPLITLRVTCHRFILAEINTHRVLSRNWRSSRAVPVKKMIDEVRNDPAMPIGLGRNQPGMVAGEPLDEKALSSARMAWRASALLAANAAENLSEIGLHKQHATRIIEPYLWAHGIISGTDWDNFFRLRLAPDAQPEFRALAECMHKTISNSEPRRLRYGEWHLPYVSDEDFLQDPKISAARCARVSYVGHNGKPTTPEEDGALADRLIKSGHMSPFEHQATPSLASMLRHFLADPLIQLIAAILFFTLNYYNIIFASIFLISLLMLVILIEIKSNKGNFKGWHQARHMYDEN